MNYPLLMMYVTSIFFLILTPGPVVALVVSTASKYGFRQAFLTTLGTNWASLMLIIFASMIISGFISIDVKYLYWVSIIGCFFLLRMAIRSLHDDFKHEKKRVTHHEDKNVERKNAPAMLTGFLVGISNPKDIIFFVAFFPQFIKVTSSYFNSLSLLIILWILFDFSILLCYITVIRTKLFKKYGRLISIISSFCLLLISTFGIVYTAYILVLE